MLALMHARLLDGTGAPPRDDMTVVVTDGRIAEIGTPGQIEPPTEATIIDLGGRTLVPLSCTEW